MRRLFVILVIIFTLSVSACSNSNSKSDTITPADLNERESSIISTTSDASFIFDYNIEAEYQKVAVWMEKYESGKLVDDEVNKLTTEIDKSNNNGTIILASSKTIDENEEKQYNIGVGDEGGTSSSIVPAEKIKEMEDQSIVSGQLADEKTLNDGEENVLATIAYSDDEYSTTSISSDFYEDPEANKDELDKYSTVYLFKTEFVK